MSFEDHRTYLSVINTSERINKKELVDRAADALTAYADPAKISKERILHRKHQLSTLKTKSYTQLNTCLSLYKRHDHDLP